MEEWTERRCKNRAPDLSGHDGFEWLVTDIRKPEVFDEKWIVFPDWSEKNQNMVESYRWIVVNDMKEGFLKVNYVVVHKNQFRNAIFNCEV